MYHVSSVTRLDSGKRRARREVAALVDSAMQELVAVRAGDMVAIHGASIDILRAVRVVMDAHLDAEQLAS